MERMLNPRPVLPEGRQIFSDKALKAMIVPLLIEQLLQLVVGIADTMMVSYAGRGHGIRRVAGHDDLHHIHLPVHGHGHRRGGDRVAVHRARATGTAPTWRRPRAFTSPGWRR